ncbi:MAG: sulfite exporter TauE/SafE family protein [Gammaproteobacteria bacterium]
MEWAYTISGFAVGVIVGLTGVGGGALMTPLLVLLFGFAPAVAVGTDLLFASITKMGGVWVHGRRGTIEWKVVGQLASGSIPASLLTLVLLSYLDVKQVNELIVPLMGVALLLTALALVFKSQLLKVSRQKESLTASWRERWLTPMTILLGFSLGFLVTLTSIGAGALGVVALFILYPLIPTVKIVGTDIAHAVPLTLVAGLGHLHMGNVDFALLGSLLLGSLPGIYLGSHLSVKIPEKVLRYMLASMLVLIGIKFVAS